jgi:hypothetical protein
MSESPADWISAGIIVLAALAFAALIALEDR